MSHIYFPQVLVEGAPTFKREAFQHPKGEWESPYRNPKQKPYDPYYVHGDNDNGYSILLFKLQNIVPFVRPTHIGLTDKDIGFWVEECCPTCREFLGMKMLLHVYHFKDYSQWFPNGYPQINKDVVHGAFERMFGYSLVISEEPEWWVRPYPKYKCKCPATKIPLEVPEEPKSFFQRLFSR